MESKEKILSMFKFLKEFDNLKNKTIRNIKVQPWICFLKDIPVDGKYIQLNYRDRVAEENDERSTVPDDFILSVQKPKFLSCPKPEEIFSEWLYPDWDVFTNVVKIRDTLEFEIPATKECFGKDEKVKDVIHDHERAVGEKEQIRLKNTNEEDQTKTLENVIQGDDVEHFSDNIDRVQSYEEWSKNRDKWVGKQKYIERMRQFFIRVYKMHLNLKNDSAYIELMIGNGLLQDKTESDVNHPVLLKRLKTSFDSSSNTIYIHDTNVETELDTMLLSNINDINYPAVKQYKEELFEKDYHPLDRNDAYDFLKNLVHSLCPESKFLAQDDKTLKNTVDRLSIAIDPVFFIRKKLNGAVQAIEKIIENIEVTGKFPAALGDIVSDGRLDTIPEQNLATLPEQLAAVGGEDSSILLAKEANKEQLEIAQRIENYNAVVVQGPPGTGKTHTIANLMGHFLAQGKSVLVTSHTQKALSVLKEKVPGALQNLCVSVLDDSNADMERSIDGITEYLSRYNSSSLKEKMNSAQRVREEIIHKLADVRQKIYSIKYKEFEPIAYNGESICPSKAAEFVRENAEKLAYIPGTVQLYHSLPLTFEELAFLYRSNEEITPDEEKELAWNLPNPAGLISPDDFRKSIGAIHTNYQNMQCLVESLHASFEINQADGVFGLNMEDRSILVKEPEYQAIQALQDYLESFQNVNSWMIYAAVDGRRGTGYRNRWQTLLACIKDTNDYADRLVEEQFGKSVTFSTNSNLSQMKDILTQMHDVFKKNGKVSKLKRFFHKQYNLIDEWVTINGENIATADDCSFVLHQIELLQMRDQCGQYWDELLGKHDMTNFTLLDSETPEKNAQNMLPIIERCLDWYENEYEKLISLIETMGIESNNIFCQKPLDSEIVATQKILAAVDSFLPVVVEVCKSFFEFHKEHKNLAEAGISFRKNSSAGSSVCADLQMSIVELDTDAYMLAFHKLTILYNKYEVQRKRKLFLATLYNVAPGWANAIQNRDGIYGESIVPENIESAWQWKQLAGIISDMTAISFEELQNQSVALSRNYREQTTKLAEYSAWYHLLKKSEQDLEMRQALQGWKLTTRKIGKGTGKNAPALKAEARKLMVKCQDAVPAWIMTVNSVLETLVPGKNEFDVIIVDEASQSDISALAVLYMGKKIIIVGDDKQVSPLAVGIDLDKINALAVMYIKDIIPNWHLYNLKTSLYDIASTTFQPLMLKEHFRCMPEIIGFSNRIAYDYNIKPLRDTTSENRLIPSVVSYRINGEREGVKKINFKEAQIVAALILSCLECPEYNEKTFGVISLLGEEQAKLIQDLLLKNLNPAIFEERRILCGNASNFQGDERDVIFLTMIDSNECGTGPLRKLSEGADNANKKRYNVAASRARDQMWVIHSLDVSKDLQSGDLRKELLDYAANPKAFSEVAKEIEAYAESPFEEMVGKTLVAKGYNIIQQWKVGAYRIDMVVIDEDKKIAIECDGMRWHSGEEKVREDMERQTILERLGWQFIRIRGTEYYRNPELTMQHVFNKLDTLSIKPVGLCVATIDRETKLLDQVKIKADLLLDEWNKDSLFPDEAENMLS